MRIPEETSSSDNTLYCRTASITKCKPFDSPQGRGFIPRPFCFCLAQLMPPFVERIRNIVKNKRIVSLLPSCTEMSAAWALVIGLVGRFA